jgi:hypothetical protein
LGANWIVGATLVVALHDDIRADVLRHCDPPAEPNVSQQSTLLRFGAVIKQELDRSGQRVALIARSGLDLKSFGIRYSHAGVSLQASANAPWSVRQLYYDCDKRRPRLFDQGVAGFLMGGLDPALGYVSVVLVPDVESAALERAVQDNRQALSLLGTKYSANAYAFAQQYQNCNQWVAEMLALAWGGRTAGDNSRAAAQQWLMEHGYTPTRFDVGNPWLMALAGVLPWLHRDDHPPEDLAQHIFRVSMPGSIEAFVRDTVPQAHRIEFCHTERHIVIRRGWVPLGEGCVAQANDKLIVLD